VAIYTGWTNKDGDTELSNNDNRPPLFNDGTEVLLWRIEAATPEEALAIHHLRLGFEPYKPMGEPAPCPKCGAIFYPEGSGECWRCGKIC
jgi:hypothetical protein